MIFTSPVETEIIGYSVGPIEVVCSALYDRSLFCLLNRAGCTDGIHLSKKTTKQNKKQNKTKNKQKNLEG